MDSKIKTLVDQATYVVQPEQYKQMMDDALKLDTKSWIEKYRDDYVNHPNLAAVWEDNGMDKYSKPKWERMRDYFGSSDVINPFKKPKAQLEAAWSKEFSDIPKEQFMQDMQKMAKSWDDETEERNRETGRIRRTREVEKEWSWPKKLLANEYSQARYIDDPNSTPFGKEGTFDPSENKLELANIGLQGASLVGDAIPGVGGYVAGPGLRLSNDLLQRAGDYGKDLTDIARDRAIDAGTSFLGEAGPNMLFRLAGRGERQGSKLLRPFGEAAEYSKLLKDKRVADEGIARWRAEPNFARRQAIIDEIPDAQVRKDLQAANDPDVWQIEKDRLPFNRDVIPQKEAENKYLQMKGKYEGIEGYRLPEEYEWTKRLAETPEPKGLFKAGAKLMSKKGAEYPATFIARKTVGGTLGNANIERPKQQNDRKLIDWYKKYYAKDWLDANFKPRENSGLMYEAWKELMKENGKEVN